MGKNRDRISIFAAILEATNSGATKTRIMFRANLSFKLLEKYLDAVTRVGFVHLEASTYELTEDGKAFLKQYKDYYKRYLEVQKLLETLGSEREKLGMMCRKIGFDDFSEPTADREQEA